MEKLVGKIKHIAIIAHDGKKKELINWAKKNKAELSKHIIYGTRTTGTLLEKELGIKVEKFRSGPLGGDLQIGTKIVEGKIDILIFVWDPLESQPHDPDIKALLRIATVYNIPIANNISTAEYILSSTFIDKEYLKVEEIDNNLKHRIEYIMNKEN